MDPHEWQDAQASTGDVMKRLRSLEIAVWIVFAAVVFAVVLLITR